MHRKRVSEQTGSHSDGSGREYNSLYPENQVHSVQYTNKYKEKPPTCTKSGIVIAQNTGAKQVLPLTDDIILNAPSSSWSHLARVENGSTHHNINNVNSTGSNSNPVNSRRSRNNRYGNNRSGNIKDDIYTPSSSSLFSSSSDNINHINNNTNNNNTNNNASTTNNNNNNNDKRTWRFQSKLELENWSPNTHTPLVQGLQQSMESMVHKWREQHGRYGMRGNNNDDATETALGWGTAGDNIRHALDRVQNREPCEELSTIDKQPDWVNDGVVLKQLLQSLSSGSQEQLMWLSMLDTVTKPTSSGDTDVYGQCPSAAQRSLLSVVAKHVKEYILAVQYSSGEQMHRVETLLSIGDIHAKHTKQQQDVQTNTITVLEQELERELAERDRWEKFVDEARQESLIPRQAAEGHGMTDVTVVNHDGTRQVVAASEVEKYIREHDLVQGGEVMLPDSVWREGRISETTTGEAADVLKWMILDEVQSTSHGSVHQTASYVEELRGQYDRQGNEAVLDELASIKEEFLRCEAWKSDDVLKKMLLLEESNTPVKDHSVNNTITHMDALKEHHKTQTLLQDRQISAHVISEPQAKQPSVKDMQHRIQEVFRPLPPTSGHLLLPQLHATQMSANALRANRALLIKQQYNGQPLTSVIFSASHYFQQPLRDDDYRAIVVVKQQHPQASNNNYQNIYYRYGAPPTADKYVQSQSTYTAANISFVREDSSLTTDNNTVDIPGVDPVTRKLVVSQTTQEHRGKVAVSSKIDASITSIASFQISPHAEGKDVFIRITGTGDAVKKYQISVRIVPFVPDFGGAIEKLVNDLDQQRVWREQVTDKLRALTWAKDIYDTTKTRQLDEERAQIELDRRRKKAAKKHRQHQQQLQEIERQNKQNLSDSFME